MKLRKTVILLFTLLALQNAWGGIPYYSPRNFDLGLHSLPLGATGLTPRLSLRTSEAHGLDLPTVSPRLAIAPDKEPAFWQQRSVHIGFGLVAAGAAVAFADNNIRAMRNDYIPTFRHHWDDYLQFSPAVIMLGMKAFGVEGRSSWGRMLSADAISAAVMLGSTYGLKYCIARLRPDGSAYNSMPSGHTAMVFMAATMLHIEYGHVSPWVSVAGYTLATATGIGRTLNNRHWLSDVVVGAGMGILGTRIGYLINDAIFGDRGLHGLPNDEFPLLDGRGNPSFIGLRLGAAALPFAQSGATIVAPSGAVVGVEGAWFFTSHVGFGGAFNIDRFALQADRNSLGGNVVDKGAINSMSLQTGLYLSYDMAPRWQAGGKLTAGTSKRQQAAFDIRDKSGAAVATLSYDSVWRFSGAAGASIGFVAARNLRLRLFAEVNAVPDGYSVGGRKVDVGYGFPLSLGVAVDALLW